MNYTHILCVVMLCHNYKLRNTKAITHIVEHKLTTEHHRPISYLFLVFLKMLFMAMDAPSGGL
jgi:hypothetical protein